MEQSEKIQIYNEAINRYGIRNQKVMVVEEVGELLNALAKSNRNRSTKTEIITELADVHIMVEQMAYFYGWEEFKPAWSEEDERLCQCLIEDQEEALDDVRNDKYGHSEIISDLKEMYRERINWLQSLKHRKENKIIYF